MPLGTRKFHPELFQGDLHKKFYFEGWYFKLIDKGSENIYAIIPGIALNRKSHNSHAFIQILNGITAQYDYIRFPISNFYAEKGKFEVSIAGNTFSNEYIHLDIKDEVNIHGDLHFSDQIKLTRSTLNPGVMGLFTWLPFMETKHEVISMNHSIHGSLEVRGKNIDFSGGKGYIEKDWGISFPSHWIWMQSNHFEDLSRSFMFSLAKIRYLGLKFTGFLGVLWNGTEMVRFGTYSRANIRNLVIRPKSIQFEIHMKKKILEVVASKSTDSMGSSKTAQMLAPDKGEMSAKCLESISSTIKLSYYEIIRNKKEIIFQDTGINAGLEIMGENKDFF